jgi:hypothetical protein
MPSYAEMLTATDLEGQPSSYLAAEQGYQWLRSFQQRNLVVPIVGDFAGPRALGAVADYLSGHGAIVTAFYTSNVEQYLFRNAVASRFYTNAMALPIDDRSVFIRSAAQRNALDPIAAFFADVRAGHILTYQDVTIRGTVR